MLRFRMNVPQGLSYESPKKTGCTLLTKEDASDVFVHTVWKEKDDEDATAPNISFGLILCMRCLKTYHSGYHVQSSVISFVFGNINNLKKHTHTRFYRLIKQ